MNAVQKKISREDLEKLYKFHCCANICPNALTHITNRILKKTIAHALWRSKVVFEEVEKKKARRKIGKKLQISRQTMYNYFPATEEE